MFKLVVLDWICPCDNIVRIYRIIVKYFSKIICKEKNHHYDNDNANVYIHHDYNDVLAEELTVLISVFLISNLSIFTAR